MTKRPRNGVRKPSQKQREMPVDCRPMVVAVLVERGLGFGGGNRVVSDVDETKPSKRG